MTAKYVFRFPDLAEIEAKAKGVWDNVKGILGGKGAGMAMMAKLGIPVPPGFTITTEACHYFLNEGKGNFPPELWNQVLEGLKAIEKEAGKKFGDENAPLFVSCRSGAKFSMPGMMDTVLNIGLNDKTSVSLAKKADERFVKDAYRRLISGFGAIVLGIPSEHFEDELKKYKKDKGVKDDPELKAADWDVLIAKFKHIIEEHKAAFPQDPYEQLRQAIGAVFNSWNSKRAFAYREQTKIPHDLGTACSIVTMVFGNMGNDCATGVAFTRSPTTGENKLYGEYLCNAQGEDVVAGIRNPTPVSEMGKEFPQAFQALLDVGHKLEKHFKNMQDVEFTIEGHKLYMLQCRDGKRTARSQVKIAIDMEKEGLITKDEAVKRVSPDDVNVLLLPQLDEAGLKEAKKNDRIIGKGVNASPGGAVGVCVFDADLAVAQKKEGKQVILVRPFTKPEDVHGFFASQGVLTGEGGATSHAAVVARQFGLPCIVGASTLLIDLKKRRFTATTESGKQIIVNEGDYISLDATKGIIYAGQLRTVAADFDKEEELKTILKWADEIAATPCRDGKPGLQVWANADYGNDAARARLFGAMGNGLCRTEHMFFEKERLPIVQKMIMAKTPEEKQKHLDELLPFQRKDFEELFTAMQGLPVIIRLLDPPLHEFLPDHIQIVEDLHKMQLAGKQNSEEYHKKEVMRLAVEDLHESNPMIGLRGCRVGVMYPAIIKMQARAIFEAALRVKATGKTVLPEIMIPLVSHVNELKALHPVIDGTAQEVFAEQKDKVHYLFGTMVETPRAALTADHVAQEAQFFSFGTNDLTQMTFGIARDDAERKFLVHYVQNGVLPANPFQTLDQDGVGQLIQGAVAKGRKVQGPNMSIGICGEVGGDPTTIEFCHRAGLSYVSCSPFRVPVARLAAAHAVLKNKK